MLEQPVSETRGHNVVAIRKWRHTNVDYQRQLIANADVRRGLDQMTSDVLHLEMKAARNVDFTKGNYTENVNI